MWILLVHQPQDEVTVVAIEEDESRIAQSEFNFSGSRRYKQWKRHSKPKSRQRLQVETIAY